MTKRQLYELLEGAATEPSTRLERIQQFQSAVFESDAAAFGLSDHEWDVLTQLAQDLDYYEPNHQHRNESTLFYGDERVVREIQDALAKVRSRRRVL